MQQHSYQLARALNSEGLFAYCTTVYYRKTRLLYRILERVLGSNNVNRMQSRQDKLLDEKTVTFCEFTGLIYLLLVRINVGFLLRVFRSILGKRFGKKVAKFAIMNNVSTIVLYDTWAYDCLKYLQNRNVNIATVLDISAIAGRTIKDIVSLDITVNGPNVKKGYKAIVDWLTPKTVAKMDLEIKYSDYFLVASQFAKRSILKHNKANESIFVCPYALSTHTPRKSKRSRGIIRFVFVGRLSASKGIHYLLRAFHEILKLGKKAELICVGQRVGPESLYSPYIDEFEYWGLKRRDEMQSVYEECDVLVLPSLYDGMSFAVLEAMMAGLPVIVTESVGAADFVNSSNGFVVKPMDTQALVDKMLWFIENSELIDQMGFSAHKSVSCLTEKYYTDCVHASFKEICPDDKQ